MKIVYCHCSVYNPGGMERVLFNKIRWIREKLGWEIILVTTDQQDRPSFYEIPEGVRFYDLGINYSVDKTLSAPNRILSYFCKRRLHRHRLTKLLMREHPDITVSLFPSESSFIPNIKDGSKKVLELHFNRYFRLQYGRKGVIGFIDRFRSCYDVVLAGRFDRFVVLTEEDKEYWGSMSNITVIPNAALQVPVESDCNAKRVLAVGRLDYQKGFDRLIEIWESIKCNPISAGWRLDIFGQGEWWERLKSMIKKKGLSDSVTINVPTDCINKEYAESSLLVMTSHYEGFPMVMVEAMSAGLPVVTFDYKCGPKDIINNGINGVIVNDGDNKAFVNAVLALMDDSKRRKIMGQEARKVVSRYSEDRVMSQWITLFEGLVT